MGDITSEVEMVEKLHNKEIFLPIPEHLDEHHESRAISAFLQKRYSKQSLHWIKTSNSRRSMQTEM